ncbi:MAG: hypothetical protein JNL44_16110, partial [Gemmatimonadetes bacterium]|nr:hypothetical protein [Gemmatimonadota bacterium]
TFRPLFPTRAALELDDQKYPASWQGEHFPGLAGGSMHLNGVTVPPASAAAFPKEVHPVRLIKADPTGTVLPAPTSNGTSSPQPTKTVSANVWAP